MKRAALGALALALAALAAWAIHKAGSRQEPVTLGYVSSLSGRFSALSGSGRDGAVLAADRVNAQGGLAGRPLRLSVLDDAFDPDRAGRAVMELAGQGASAVIGPFASAMAKPMVAVSADLKVLIVSPTVSSDDFTGKDDLFLRLIPTTADYSSALGRHMARRGMRKLAVLMDVANGVYTASAARFTREGFLAGGGNDYLLVEYDSRQSPSYKDLAAKALSVKPDGVLMISGPLDTALLCQHLRLADAGKPLFSSTWGMSLELIESGGRAVEGVESVVPYDPGDTSAAYLEFVRAYAERFGRNPDYASMYNYETVMLLARALAVDPSAKGEKLKAIILGQNPQQGLQSQYSLDRFGDVSRPLHLLTVENGHFLARAEKP